MQSSLQKKLKSSDATIEENLNPNKFTFYDGDDVRDVNQDYHEYSSQFIIGYTNISDFMASYVHEAKYYFLNEIIENQCNIVISTVVSKDDENKIQYLTDLKNAGYEMHYIFVYADYAKTVLRVKNRAQWTGRWFDEGEEEKEF